jgi:hypothetical protein
MAWETRRNKKYFYRKKRIGKKVVSVYVGKYEPSPSVRREHIQDIPEVDRDFLETEREIQLLIKCLLIIGGYHTHHRQWRKKR